MVPDESPSESKICRPFLIIVIINFNYFFNNKRKKLLQLSGYYWLGAKHSAYLHLKSKQKAPMLGQLDGVHLCR